MAFNERQELMIETIKKVLSDRIVLENTRGILGGLELDCYIPDSRIAFEYDGKQHFERVEHFQREKKDFKEQLKRDKEKEKLCKKLGIKLIRIKYNEEITEELIQNKLFELNTLKIVKIEDIGECDTFDIIVEDNNNFYLENNINSKNSGKSVGLKTVIEGYHDNLGYKVFDFYGGERHEGIYWVFPSQEKKYWDKFRRIGNFDEEGPKQYKCNLLYPYFGSTLPKKLPFKEGVITSKVFTIPLKDIQIEDLKTVLGTISDTSGYVWNEIVNKATKKDTCAILDDLCKMFGGLNTLLYKNFITPLKREKFIMNEGCSTNLDLKAEADDKEVITILCLDFVPEKFHLFIIAYLLKKMKELMELNKIKKKNIIFMREVSKFFRTLDDSVTDQNLLIFRGILSNFLRYGRRGMQFAMDVQAFNEVRGILSGGEDFCLMFKNQSFRDREELTEPYRREKRMRPDQINNMAFLEVGECYIVETGMRNVIKTKMVLPRSDFWKKEYPNFHKSLWERRGGDWKTTNQVKEEIDELYEQNKNKYEEEIEKKKDKRKIKEPSEASELFSIIPVSQSPQPLQTPPPQNLNRPRVYPF